MKVILRVIIALGYCVLATMWWRCSTNQNTITADAFHNTTAHFNGYFYAREKTREVEKIILPESMGKQPAWNPELKIKSEGNFNRKYKKPFRKKG